MSRTTRIWSTSTEQCRASFAIVLSARGCSHRQATWDIISYVFARKGIYRTHQVRDEAVALDGLDGVLGRFCFLLVVDRRDVGDVNGHEVDVTNFMAQLPESLHERHALDVTDGTTELDDAHIGLFVGAIHRCPGDALDPVLYGIRDMWDAAIMDPVSGILHTGGDQVTWPHRGRSVSHAVACHVHLNRLSQVITAALFLDDLGGTVRTTKRGPISK